MPNPGKPAESKRLVGSRHYKPKDVVYVLPKADNAPLPLRELGDSGKRLWDNAWQLGRNWISDRSDYELLIMTCEQLDERDSLRAYVISNMEAWHERAGLRVLERDIASNLSTLGFTPTDRMKLGLAEVKTVSKLDELMARKANRVASPVADSSPAE